MLLTELQTVRFRPIGPGDVASLLRRERLIDELGCDGAACVAEIGDAVNAPLMLAGGLGVAGQMTVLSLKIIRVGDSEVLARVNESSHAGLDELPYLVAVTVQRAIATLPASNWYAVKDQ